MESSNTFSDISYTILKEDDHLSDIHVFSVTKGPLPIYIRTITPKRRPSSNISEAKDEESDNWPYCLTNIRCLILLVTFLVSSTLTGYLIASKYWPKDIDFLSSNETKTLPMESVSLKTEINVTDVEQFSTYNIVTSQSTPCVSRCIPYRGRRFDSQCMNGYCACSGSNYQRETCLPTVNGCNIKRHSGSTYMDRRLVPSYTCRSSNYSNVHVISVYGNHFSEVTSVHFRAHPAQNITVVLASHYPVRWKLTYPENIAIQNIVLVSDRNILSLDVNLVRDSKNYTRPVITRFRMPVGYGDDRHGMDTVKMLQIIEKKYGHVNSFTGADFADQIITDASGV